LGNNEWNRPIWQKRELPDGKIVELDSFEKYLLEKPRDGLGQHSFYNIDGNLRSLLDERGTEALRLIRIAIPDWDERIKEEAKKFREHTRKGKRKESAKRTFEDVKSAFTANPDATEQQIADVVGVSQQRVSQVTSEIQAKSEPKLLNVGANQHTACDNDNTLNDRGTSPDYIKARLIRDGHIELADQVKAKKVSARKAAILVGYITPEVKTPLTELKRLWKKATEVDRQSFKLFIEEK
jgi:hypothetical protein